MLKVEDDDLQILNMFLKKIIFIFLFIITGLTLKAQYRYSYLQLGRRELSNQNYLAAIEDFNETIKNYPGQYEGYYYRSIAKYYLNDYLGAREDIAKAIEIIPKLPDLYLIRGVIKAGLLDINGALSDYAYALKLDSTYLAVYYYRALTYVDLHEFNKALADCNKLTGHADKFDNLHVIKGVILANLLHYNEAIKELTLAISSDSNNVTAYVERGSVYMSNENTQLAMKDFTHALKMDSLNAYAWYQTGIANMKLMNYDEALKDFNRVIKLSPGNEMAYFNRAIIRSNTNESGEALSDYNRILNQNPDNVLVYYNKGITQYRMGNYKGAIESFSHAIKLFPDYADAYHERGMVRLAIGDQKGYAADMEKSKIIGEKNIQKNDSTKFNEGLKILKLTRFSGDFSEPSSRAGKVQYKQIDINLKPVYLFTFDPDNSDKMQVYKSKDSIHYSFNVMLLSNDFEQEDTVYLRSRINRADSMIRSGNKSNKNYLIRGCLNILLGNYNASVPDFDQVLSKQPDNITALFSRANARLLMLNKFINRSDSTGTVVNNQFSQIWKENNFSLIRNDYNRVISLDSAFTFAWYNKGYAEFLHYNYQGSLQDFLHVTKNAEWASAYYNSGLLMLLLNDKRNGCENLSKAGEMGIPDAYRVIKLHCNK